MDPKKQPSLDPKLKEIYDRVMGMQTTKIQPIEKPRLFQHNSSPKTFVESSTSSSKKSMRIIFITIGVLFLVVYILFWLRFFNIPLPFTLPF